jgi:hypothetical protein
MCNSFNIISSEWFGIKFKIIIFESALNSLF